MKLFYNFIAFIGDLVSPFSLAGSKIMLYTILHKDNKSQIGKNKLYVVNSYAPVNPVYSVAQHTPHGSCVPFLFYISNTFLFFAGANVNYGRLMVPATGICGHNLPSPVTYRSSSNFIILEFYTDSIPDRRYGFRVRYARYQYYSGKLSIRYRQHLRTQLIRDGFNTYSWLL